jgi:hypothetical protein
MAAFESGTLGYFREDVVNLDGKVNSAALRARRAGATHRYLLRADVDVMVDIATPAPARLGWPQVAELGRFKVWVRPGREHCLR